MSEKAYNTMGSTGALNLVLGICAIAGGIAAGVLLIVHGAKLLSCRKNFII